MFSARQSASDILIVGKRGDNGAHGGNGLAGPNGVNGTNAHCNWAEGYNGRVGQDLSHHR